MKTKMKHRCPDGLDSLSGCLKVLSLSEPQEHNSKTQAPACLTTGLEIAFIFFQD